MGGVEISERAGEEGVGVEAVGIPKFSYFTGTMRELIAKAKEKAQAAAAAIAFCREKGLLKPHELEIVAKGSLAQRKELAARALIRQQGWLTGKYPGSPKAK